MLLPVGTETLGGTLAAKGLLTDSVTGQPLETDGAGPFSMTVQADVCPLVTIDGLHVMD